MSYNARQLFEKYKYSVCQIKTGTGTGSGYVVDRSHGIIVTNAHVVKGSAPTPDPFCRVEIGDSSYSATLLAYGDECSENDFALLRAAYLPSCIGECTLRESHPTPGEQIFIMGHPLGASLTITQGIINNPAYVYDNETYILTDTTINPGNSGGPMFDENGQVLGTVVSKIVREGITGQHFVLSVAQYRSFLSRSGIDLNSGYFPSSPRYVPKANSGTYSGTPYSGTPMPANPYGSNPFGGNPFGGSAAGAPLMIAPDFAPPLAVGQVIQGVDCFGQIMPMCIACFVDSGMQKFAVLLCGNSYVLYQVTVGGLLLVSDMGFAQYVINFCRSVGKIQ